MFTRKRSLAERVGEALGRKPRKSGFTPPRSALIALGAAAGVTALSAVASAVRARQDDASGQGGA